MNKQPKLIWTMLVLVIIAILSAVPALADSSDDSDVLVFNSNTGAELRFLQLEQSIAINIAHGEELLVYLNDTTEVESIIVDLAALKDEVASVELDQDLDTLAELFVAYKDEAVDLSNQFRTEVHAQINTEDIVEMRETIREETKESAEEYRVKVQEKRHQFNQEIALNILGQAGIDDAELIAEIERSNATYGSIRSAIAIASQNMSIEERQALAQQMKEVKAKANVRREQAKDNAMNRREDIKARVQTRIENGNISAKLGIGILEHARERIHERMQSRENNMQERREEMRDNNNTSGSDIRAQARVNASANVGVTNGPRARINANVGVN